MLLTEYAKLMRYTPNLDDEYLKGQLRLTPIQFERFVGGAGLRSCPFWRPG